MSEKEMLPQKHVPPLDADVIEEQIDVGITNEILSDEERSKTLAEIDASFQRLEAQFESTPKLKDKFHGVKKMMKSVGEKLKAVNLESLGQEDKKTIIEVGEVVVGTLLVAAGMYGAIDFFTFYNGEIPPTFTNILKVLVKIILILGGLTGGTGVFADGIQQILSRLEKKWGTP